MNFTRNIQSDILRSLGAVPAVAVVGPRQTGKTTLARQIATTWTKPCTYIDLASDPDWTKLLQVQRVHDHLVIIDEAQLAPKLFHELQALINSRSRAGETVGQFLLFCSTPKQLLQKQARPLAADIDILQMAPLNALEISAGEQAEDCVDRLWWRGGFPKSYLADSEASSQGWRSEYIQTHVEHHILSLGAEVSSAFMFKLWRLLAHRHSQHVNFIRLGAHIGLSHQAVRHYFNVLVEHYMVREIEPWSGRVDEDLVTAPKIFIRDSGITHELLEIPDFKSLLAHAAAGASWESFVLENVLNCVSDSWKCTYFRTTAGAEIDLVMANGQSDLWAVEIKRSATPSASRGYHTASRDIGATRKFIVYPGRKRYMSSAQTEVIGLLEFLNIARQQAG